MVDVGNGLVRVNNKYFFTDLSDFYYKWRLEEDGKVIAEGDIIDVNLLPQQNKIFKTTFPKVTPKDNSEYFLNFYAYQKNDDGLLKKGDLIASEQVEIPLAGNALSGNLAKFGDDIYNGRVKVGFNPLTGALNSYKINGQELIKNELELNFWRASTDNDMGSDLAKRCYPWKEAGKEAKLVSMSKTDLTNDSYKVVSEYVLPESVGNSKYIVTYTVNPNGAININSLFVPGNDTLPLMPRIGFTLTLNKEFNGMEWFGRGPHENYIDRNTSSFVGLYSGLVAEQYFPYDRPQENGNKTDVRWMSLSNKKGLGLKAVGEPYISTSAYHFDNADLCEPELKKTQRHMNDVKEKDLVTWNIDLVQMGVGGDTSWGAYPHQQYLLPANRLEWNFTLVPKGD